MHKIRLNRAGELQLHGNEWQVSASELNPQTWLDSPTSQGTHELPEATWQCHVKTFVGDTISCESCCNVDVRYADKVLLYFTQSIACPDPAWFVSIRIHRDAGADGSQWTTCNEDSCTRYHLQQLRSNDINVNEHAFTKAYSPEVGEIYLINWRKYEPSQSQVISHNDILLVFNIYKIPTIGFSENNLTNPILNQISFNWRFPDGTCDLLSKSSRINASGFDHGKCNSRS